MQNRKLRLISKAELDILNTFVSTLQTTSKTIEEKELAVEEITATLKDESMKIVLGDEKIKEIEKKIVDYKKQKKMMSATSVASSPFAIKKIDINTELEESFAMPAPEEMPVSVSLAYLARSSGSVLSYDQEFRNVNDEIRSKTKQLKIFFETEIKEGNLYLERSGVIADIQADIDTIKRTEGEIDKILTELNFFKEQCDLIRTQLSLNLSQKPKYSADILVIAKKEINTLKKEQNIVPNLNLLAKKIKINQELLEKVNNNLEKEKQIAIMAKKYRELKEKMDAFASDIRKGIQANPDFTESKKLEFLKELGKAEKQNLDLYDIILSELKKPETTLEIAKENYATLESFYESLLGQKITIYNAKIKINKEKIEKEHAGLDKRRKELSAAFNESKESRNYFAKSILDNDMVSGEEKSEDLLEEKLLIHKQIDDVDLEYEVDLSQMLLTIPALDLSDIQVTSIESTFPDAKMNQLLGQRSDWISQAEERIKTIFLDEKSDVDKRSKNLDDTMNWLFSDGKIKDNYDKVDEYYKHAEEYQLNEMQKVNNDYKKQCIDKLLENTCKKLEVDLKNQLLYWSEHQKEIKHGVTVIYSKNGQNIPVKVPNGLGEMLRVLDPSCKPESRFSKISFFNNKQKKENQQKVSSPFEKLQQCNKIAKRRVMFATLKKRANRKSDGQKHNTDILTAMVSLDMSLMKKNGEEISDENVRQLAKLNASITKNAVKGRKEAIERIRSNEASKEAEYTPPTLPTSARKSIS